MLLANLYRKLWKATTGRPYTFIIRDTWARYEGLWIVGLVACGAIAGHYWGIIGVLKGLGIFTIGYIAGHLFWGTRYNPDEREK